MSNKRRPNKRITKNVQEEIDEFMSQRVDRKVIGEFVKVKEPVFELTNKQKHLMRILKSNSIVTVTGPPGTSKTFIACYAAIQEFMKGKYEKIILSKPTEVLSGTKDPGALPGTLDEKMAVYAESFFDAFEEFMEPKDFKHLWDSKIIEFKPAQFLRGRSIKNAFIIIDEFQNFDSKALKSIVTRKGRGSTIVFMGDTRQNDINKKHVAVDIFNQLIDEMGEGCATFKFERADIVRDPLLIKLMDKWEQYEDEGKWPDTIKGA
jgi:phosphate starvation-inducible protein PhoH and related proteins